MTTEVKVDSVKGHWILTESGRRCPSCIQVQGVEYSITQILKTGINRFDGCNVHYIFDHGFHGLLEDNRLVRTNQGLMIDKKTIMYGGCLYERLSQSR